MKRFEIVRFSGFQYRVSFHKGFFDNRRNRRSWKYLGIGIGRWMFKLNYGLVNYE